MPETDYGEEILYVIEQGHNRYNEIYEHIRRINKDKTKFQDQIKSFVKLGMIKRITKDGRPFFSVDDDWNYSLFLEHIENIKKELKDIKEKTKKYSNRKLLRFSTKYLINNLNQLGPVAFLKTTESQKNECIKELRNSCNVMMEILEKRGDPKLTKICYQTVLSKLPGLHYDE